MNKKANKGTGDKSILSAFHRRKYLPKWLYSHLPNKTCNFHSFPSCPFFHLCFSGLIYDFQSLRKWAISVTTLTGHRSWARCQQQSTPVRPPVASLPTPVAPPEVLPEVEETRSMVTWWLGAKFRHESTHLIPPNPLYQCLQLILTCLSLSF